MSRSLLGVRGLILVSVVAAVLAVAGPASAAPGSPGVPGAPVTLFQEDFENVPNPALAQGLATYVGAAPLAMTYTADPVWLNGPACNGVIASYNSSPGATGCAAGVFNTYIRAIAAAMGATLGGGRDNQVMGDVTASAGAAPATPAPTLQTATPIALPSASRFVTFSIDAGAMSCGVARPLLRFFLLDGATPRAVTNTAINACTDPRGTVLNGVRVGRYATDNALLLTGGSVGVRLTNDQTNGNGNDYAVDNLRILDATPQLDKDFADDVRVIGERTRLTFTVTNTSDLAAKRGWSFTDTLPPGMTIANPAAATTDCANGTVSAPAGGTAIDVTGDLGPNVAACRIALDVTADTPGTYPNGPANISGLVGLSAPGTDAVRFVPRHPVLELDKRAGAINDLDANGVDAGDTLDYTFVLSNPGNVALDTVRVSDVKAGLVSCLVSTLPPGATTTCTAAPYVLTQTDVDRGAILNDATAAGSPPAGPDVTASDGTTTLIGPAPGVVLDKRASALADNDANGIASAGDQITYSFAVTNTGNVTLVPVTVTDATAGPVSCPAGGVPPGATVACTAATYTVTQADVVAGAVTNRATVSAQPPVGPPVTAEDSVTTPLPPAPAIAVEKRALALSDLDGDGRAGAGDTIAYTFTVTNTGNLPLDPVTLSDPKVGPVTCPPAPLPPGASRACNAAPYTLTQADVNAGSVENTATATGAPPSGPPVSDEDTTTTPTPAVPAVYLEKTVGGLVDANHNAVQDAGDELTYRFAVTNSGNVTLTDVTVDDPTLGPVTCPPDALQPGDSVQCTPVTYVVTAADTTAPGPGIAPGVSNTATVTARPPTGPVVTDDDSLFTAVPSVPAVRLQKSAGAVTDRNANGIVDAGDTISYSFAVSNTGNQILTSVGVTDPQLGPVTCTPADPLPPGGRHTCGPAEYVITQADVVAGEVVNTATASGTPPVGAPVTDDDTTTAQTPAEPGIKLDKRAGALTDVDGNAIAGAGDTIDYSFVVTNTGNVPLDPVRVQDPKVKAITCPPGPLAPQASVTCTADDPYPLVQSEVTAGAAVNSATATGTAPSGEEVTSSDTTSTPTPPAPAVQLKKRAGALTDVDDNGVDRGDTLAYRFVVTNTGNVPLQPVAVSDPTAGPVTCPGAALDPGATVICDPVLYTLTQADLDGGRVTNAATVSASPPAGGPVTDADTVTLPVPRRPAIALQKRAGALRDLDGNGTDAGDTIDYTFVVTNTGNVSLDPVTVSDPKAGTVTCPPGPLAPGGSVTCSAVPYPLTQGDVLAGRVVNAATAIGRPPTGADVTSTDTVTSILPPVRGAGPQPTASLSLDKQAGRIVDRDANGADAGDTISYRFVVTNTGSVRVTSVKVSDPKLGAVTCPLTALDPGQTMICTAKAYMINPAEARLGRVVNRATVSGSGTGPTGPASAGDTVTTPLPPRPILVLVKRADKQVMTAGHTLRYRLTLRNRGKGTARNARVCDRLPGGTSVVSRKGGRQSGRLVCWTIGALAPGRARTVSIELRMDRVARTRTVRNTATASATGARTAVAGVSVRVRGVVFSRPGGVTG